MNQNTQHPERITIGGREAVFTLLALIVAACGALVLIRYLL